MGKSDANTVIFSVILDAGIGNFEYDWIGLFNAENSLLGFVQNASKTPKIKTTATISGNTITRNFAVNFENAANAFGITAAAAIWQADISALFAAQVKYADIEDSPTDSSAKVPSSKFALGLQNALNTETSARKAADTSLQNNVNAKLDATAHKLSSSLTSTATDTALTSAGAKALKDAIDTAVEQNAGGSKSNFTLNDNAWWLIKELGEISVAEAGKYLIIQTVEADKSILVDSLEAWYAGLYIGSTRVLTTFGGESTGGTNARATVTAVYVGNLAQGVKVITYLHAYRRNNINPTMNATGKISIIKIGV